jgi:hypothetical protein
MPKPNRAFQSVQREWKLVLEDRLIYTYAQFSQKKEKLKAEYPAPRYTVRSSNTRNKNTGGRNFAVFVYDRGEPRKGPKPAAQG